MKQPKCFRQPVDITKINMKVIREWVDDYLSQELPDDDIVADYVGEMLEEPNASALLEQMMGFLGEEQSMKFCRELWEMMLNAQLRDDGIPEKLVQRKESQNTSRTNYNRREKEEKVEKRDDTGGYDNRHRGGYDRRKGKYHEKERDHDRRYGGNERDHGRYGENERHGRYGENERHGRYGENERHGRYEKHRGYGRQERRDRRDTRDTHDRRESGRSGRDRSPYSRNNRERSRSRER